MKKFSLWLPLAAVLIAVGLSAFSWAGSSKKQTQPCPPCCPTGPCVWYRYIGPVPGSPGTWANPAFYTLYSPQPTDIKVVCPRNQVLCAVKFRYNGPQPAAPIPTACIAAIINATQTSVETPCIELRFMP